MPDASDESDKTCHNCLLSIVDKNSVIKCTVCGNLFHKDADCCELPPPPSAVRLNSREELVDTGRLSAFASATQNSVSRVPVATLWGAMSVAQSCASRKHNCAPELPAARFIADATAAQKSGVKAFRGWRCSGCCGKRCGLCTGRAIDDTKQARCIACKWAFHVGCIARQWKKDIAQGASIQSSVCMGNSRMNWNLRRCGTANAMASYAG
ncbi:hypothetical protein AURDEDRAFT_123500 [Auricularia subglabra TFB-10046 SS5]|nr:hypothetical protein AURDEDRAFT_123500 [Auricularia subglabra TFB-10046 SS5]